MWVDKRLEFSDSQAVTTSNAPSTNHIDFSQDRDIGVGHPVYLVVQVDVALTDNYSVLLQTDTDNGFSTALETLATIEFAENDAAGTRKYIAFPNRNKRFVRLLYDPDAADGGGTFSAWLTHQKPADYQSYPDNVPV